MDDSCESILCEISEPLHQELEEGGVMSPRGGVGVRVGDVSSDSVPFNLLSCGGECLCEALFGLVEGTVGMADVDCDELYLPP
jgi:hypothetical protein